MTAIETERAVREATNRPTAADWKTTCLNCGSALSGTFCSECGQRAAPPHPSLRELGGEAFAEFSGWDGKVAETIRALIRKPGKLTVEFLEGRRARYISPLRLYLSCSVIYFLLAALTPTSFRSSVVIAPGPTAGVGTRQRIPAGKTAGITEADRQQIAQMIDQSTPILRPLMRRVSDDPKAFQGEMFASLPKALFALLPVFAGIVALFYRRRRFAEHLYFAFHLHAFIFVALSLSAVVKLTHSLPLEVVTGVAVLLWLPVYAHLAFRRVYADRASVTLLKEFGIGTLYLASSIPAIFVLALWVASR